MGSVRFGVPQDLVLWARETFKIRSFIETGTNRAQTAVWAAQHFPKVTTIEGQESLYNAALSNYGQSTPIQFLHGDSRALLGPTLEAASESAILWLDAHWCGEGTFGPTAECPLLEELDVANRSPQEHVILIDDARLFVAPPPLPHSHKDWPDLLEVSAKLLQGPFPRYAVIVEDVIVAVPSSGREALVDFVRSRPAPKDTEHRSSLPKKLLRFAMGSRRRA